MRVRDRDRDRGSLSKRARCLGFRGKDRHQRVSVSASARPIDEKGNRSSRRSVIGGHAKNIEHTDRRRSTVPIVASERSRNQSRTMAVLLLLLLQPSRTPASGESILVLSSRYFYPEPNHISYIIYSYIYLTRGRFSSRFGQLRNGGSTRRADLVGCAKSRHRTQYS